MELIHDDRRTDRRYEIELELRYKLIARGQPGLQGTGKTYNISSGGLLFETDQRLPTGAFVEVSINWPILLQDTCPLTLMMVGKVVRSDVKGAALRVTRYEFLTRPMRNGQAPAPESKSRRYMI